MTVLGDKLLGSLNFGFVFRQMGLIVTLSLFIAGLL